MTCLCGKKVEWTWADTCLECTDEAMFMMEYMQDNSGLDRSVDHEF